MHSEVCSIYMYYEETQELVLKATKGLNPKAIGHVKLKLGEGLTGQAVLEKRSICVKNASQSPGYKYFPGIGEELYESFLVVPILRGNTTIGAMAIQNSKKNYFTEKDIRVFKAITSQLATTIESAKLIIGLHENHHVKKEVSLKKNLKFIKGRVGSEGFAFAEGYVVDYRSIVSFLQNKEFAKPYKLEDFYRAVQLSERQLETLQVEIEKKLLDVASLIFTAQILMLKDQSFIDDIVHEINKGKNPPAAIVKIIEQYTEKFEELPHHYLREKKQDLMDICNRLLGNLMGISRNIDDYKGRIVIAQELFPSDILKLSSQDVKGIILLSGGITSHVSILARSLKIPVIITETIELLKIAPKTRILIDAEQGNIFINPATNILEPFLRKEQERLRMKSLKDQMKSITKTKDGTRIRLLANINLLGDLKAATEYKSEGIGLYRTEFPFIVRSNFPTEEEQYIIYKKLVDEMVSKEVTFRTLDIGGDKVLSYFNYEKEENPFLGMRSIRFSLKNRDVFGQQIRAILRAGIGADLRIMFPMISSVDEFLEAKEFVLRCLQDLIKEEIPCHKNPKIGMMVELPSVLEILEDLAKEADFFSIGTNDFIQYMLAVDRTNEKVADLYLPHHPSVLRSLKRIVEAAKRHKKEVTLCGDMAHDEKYLPYLLGIGIRKFSLDTYYLPKIQRTIESIKLKQIKDETKLILLKNKIRDIDQILEKKGRTVSI